MDNYLEAMIRIEMGNDVIFTVVCDKKLNTTQEVKTWAEQALDELPETFKNFGDFEIYIRRIYPEMVSKWQLLQGL